MKKEKLLQRNGVKDSVSSLREEVENQFGQLALLFGSKARSIMLWNLLDGRAYTATELSLCAEISAQSASNHLIKLIEANLLAVEKQGRHHYYRFANPDVAQVVESMASLLPISQNHKKKKRPVPTGELFARTCYDHLAGKVGVDIAEALAKKGLIETVGKTYSVTDSGKEWFKTMGINMDEVISAKRSFAHPCLDWSERKHHIAGALGAAILWMMLMDDWVRRKENSREVIITPKGKKALKNKLDLII